jgi:hypothetical protein
MQINQLSPCDTVESMIRALRTGNYSVVIGWLPEELTEEEHFRLTEAAEEGNAIGFIMRPVRSRFLPQRTTFWAKNSLKFVSLSEIKIFPGIFLTARWDLVPGNCGKACLVRFSLILLHKIRSKMLNNRYTELFFHMPDGLHTCKFSATL